MNKNIPDFLAGIAASDKINTDHDKNLDYFQDNYPTLLDEYINFYENSVVLSDETISSEDMVEIVKLVESFKSELTERIKQYDAKNFN